MFENFGIDHIGIAVRNLETECQKYVNDLGLQITCKEELEDRGVSLVFLESKIRGGGSAIELMAPLGTAGPIQKFLEKRGPGLHHICYQVADIQAAVSQLLAANYQAIDKAPRHGARGSEVFFFHPSSFSGVLTEICSYKQKPL